VTVRSLVAIPVAGGLFVHWGFDLPMSLGAIAMMVERLLVAANAQLLRRLKLVHESSPIGRPMHAAV
jgi:Cu2+-exporting ATPase